MVFTSKPTSDDDARDTDDSDGGVAVNLSIKCDDAFKGAGGVARNGARKAETSTEKRK